MGIFGGLLGCFCAPSTVLAGGQSTLHPHSHAAHALATLWWVLLIGSAIVVAVVTLLVVVAVLRRRGEVAAPDRSGGGARLVLVSGALVPVVVLIALFVYVLTTLDATAQPTHGTRLTIDVVGRQWFWDVRYPRERIVTANELHIPVGVPVKVRVRTADVIHSFWVPELNRKLDMVPGRRNAILLQADEPGVYRGQCAEFCGLQHANMAFLVIAEPRASYERWVAREQRAAPAAPRAEQAFVRAGCGGCHTIAGVADGNVGPDLTHFGSRRMIAAATIPNTRARLAEWIRDPQHVKPGSRMPALALSRTQVAGLVDYLEGLR